ncbi:MAG: hypothetical protein AAF741_03685 [Bacteroidota bacterium]
MEDHKNPSQQGDSDNLTLRDILLGVGAYSREIWRRKWWVLAFIVVFGGWFAWDAYKTPITYSARLTFMLNEDQGGGSALGGVLGQFGLGGGSSEFNLTKVVELSKSRKIVQDVLLDSAVIDEANDVIANHIIDIYDLPGYWADLGMTKFSDVRFGRKEVHTFNRVESKVLQQLIRFLNAGYAGHGPLVSLLTDDGAGILTYRAKTLNEDLSYELSNRLYKELSDFYIEKTTGNPRQTFERLSIRADSLSKALEDAEYKLARTLDASLSLGLNRDRVVTDQLRREVQILSTMYGEVLRNLAVAEFSLSNATPFFALIDEPMYPLIRNREYWFQRGILGAFIAAFLAVLVVVFRKIILDNLKED